MKLPIFLHFSYSIYFPNLLTYPISCDIVRTYSKHDSNLSAALFKTMKNTLLSLTTIAVASVLFATPVVAGTNATYGDVICQPQYGGNNCENVELLIDKKVAEPTATTKGGTLSYKDNLGVNDEKYAAGQKVTFQLTVKNTSDKELRNITVKDVLPQYLTVNTQDNKDWKYDSNTRTLSRSIDRLNAGESRNFTVVATVAQENALPSNQDITCVINQSFAQSGNMTVQDNAQLCVTKKVTTKGGLPVHPAPKAKSTPQTGPEALALIGLIPAGLSGLYLRKRTGKN